MKEVKEFKKSYVFVSTLYVVLGAVLLAWPDISVKMICYVLGFSMLVIGFAYGIIYFTRDNLAGVLQLDLVIGIVAAAFGIFILLNQTFLASVLPFAMGIILLLGSVIKLQNSISMKRLKFKKWYVCLAFALVIVALGIVLLVNPFTSNRFMVLYIGSCLILDGLVNLVTMACILTRMKKLAKIQDSTPEPDRIVDPSDLIEQEEKETRPAVKKKRK